MPMMPQRREREAPQMESQGMMEGAEEPLDETMVPAEGEDEMLAAMGGGPAPRGLAPADMVMQATNEINAQYQQQHMMLEQTRLMELEAMQNMISEAARGGSEVASGPEGLY